MIVSRRHFLQQAGAAAAVSTMLSSNLEAQTAQSGANAAAITRDTTLKFNPDGSVHPFAGNTVICHLPAQCAMRDAMAGFRAELAASSFRDRLGLTTVDSYHMTIFPGANDQGRKATGWPSYVPIDAPIEECNRLVEERMHKVRLRCELPFRVVVDEAATLQAPHAMTLRMRAVDAAEETKLRFVRDLLSTIYGFRLPDHATYGFHITMSYQVAQFPPQERATFESMRRDHVRRIMQAQPVLELGNPEYCVFPDMFHFEPKLLLVCG